MLATPDPPTVGRGIGVSGIWHGPPFPDAYEEFVAVASALIAGDRDVG
jgi:hypothetical protein